MLYGLGMSGMEGPLNMVAATVRARFQPCTYLEIGVASGQTMAAICKILSTRGDGWRAAGVDLPDGYSLVLDDIERNFVGQHLNVAIVRPNGEHELEPTWNRATVYLDDSHDLLPRCWRAPLHLVLIDACHCKECVTKDFLNVEPHVPTGGVVMFHDFGEDNVRQIQQGKHRHVDVRGACSDLGLIGETRPGWRYRCEIVGNKKEGAANMGVFERL